MFNTAYENINISSLAAFLRHFLSLKCRSCLKLLFKKIWPNSWWLRSSRIQNTLITKKFGRKNFGRKIIGRKIFGRVFQQISGQFRTKFRTKSQIVISKTCKIWAENVEMRP